MKKILAVLLAVQVSIPFCAAAQQPAAPAAQAPASAPPPVALVANSLKIHVLEGQNAVNRTDTQQGTPPVVEVRDENDKPVEGATVVFRLPPDGAGGKFGSDALSRTFKTNVQGQAMATGFTPNDQPGAFRIHVTATAGNKIGETDINQTNSNKLFAARPKPSLFKLSRKWKLVAAGTAVGAVVVVVLLTTGGSSQNPAITITPGPVSIGGR